MDEELEQTCCPLITEYTDRLGISHELLEKLYVVRRWELDEENNPIPFSWPKLLRKNIYDVNKQVETDEPLRIRQYQLQAIHHLSRMTRFILGDQVGLGKTISTLAAFCWLKERYPDYKLVVVTTKSTSLQWADEVERFTYLHPYVMQDKYKGLKSSEARYQQLIQFLEGKKKDVMVIKYSSMIGTRKKIEGKFDEDGKPVNGKEKVSSEIKTFSKILKEHKQKVILVFDEAHRFKNQSSTRTLVFNIVHCATRVWLLTATVIKNSLEEFYSIAVAAGISPLGSMWDFKDNFCITRQQYIGRGRHKEIVVGYKNVAEFKAAMRPFFLGRTQKQVKEPLPILSTMYHPVDLDEKQRKLLLEDIPNGTFQLPPALVKVDGELYEKERDPDNLMAQPLHARLLTPTGWVTMGEAYKGMPILDPDGGAAVVEGVYPQGVKPIYRLTTKSGATTECSEDHLWLVQNYYDRFVKKRAANKWVIRTTKEILDRGVAGTRNSRGKKVNFYTQHLPVPSPVTFSISEEPLPLPPYTMGVLLGDGSITSSVKFSALEVEIVKRVESELPASLSIHTVPHAEYHLISAASRKKGSNVYLNGLRMLGLFGKKAQDKCIPRVYMLASISDRVEMLRGLMDTDGSCAQGCGHFSVASKQLAEDVVELVRSLGGVASLRGPYTTGMMHEREFNGRKFTGNYPMWAVSLRLPVNPFNLARKRNKWRQLDAGNAIISIEYVGDKPCQCIKVSSKRHLYITDDYLVTHNTMLSVQSLVTNHWALLDRKNEKEFHTTKLSPKEECLLDLIDGDYRGEKCIIYTRFRSFIDRLQWLTENGYFTSRKFLRITGAENEKQRADAKRKFQDPDSGYDLLFCNDAALEGVNLQSANHLITMDLPWSWGNLLQLIGRMCRMASRHAANTFHIIVAKGTIDEYVIDTLKNKRGVFSKILGESASAGILDNGEILNLGSGMEDVKGEEEFKSLLKAFIKSVPMSKFLEGEMLESAQEEGDQYQMTFEKSPKKKRKQKSLKDEIGKHCDEIELL